MNPKKIILLILLVFYTTMIVVGQPYQFRMGTEPADSFIYRITETTDFTIKTDVGKERINESKIVDYKLLKPRENQKNSDFKTKVTIQDILIEKKQGDDKYLYDSRVSDTRSEPLHRSYAKLLDHRFDINFDTLGRMDLADNYNIVFDEKFRSLDIFDDTDFKKLKFVVQEKFSDNTFEHAMRYFQYVYPIDSINVGESWSVLDTIYPNYGILSKMTYTLKEIKNNIVYINIKSDLTKDPNFRGLDLEDMYLKFDLQGQQEGLVLLDLKNGWIRKMSLAQELSGKMTIFFIDPQGEMFKIKLRGSTDYDLINY